MKFPFLIFCIGFNCTYSIAQPTIPWFYGQVQVPGFGITLQSDVVQAENGSVYLTNVCQSPYKRDVFVHKMDPTGQILWSKRYLGNNIQYMDNVRSGLLPDGSLVVAWSASSPDCSGVFRLDTDGVPIWSFRFSESPTLIHGMQMVGDNCLLAGECKQQPLAACIALDGQLRWARITTDTFLPSQRSSAWYSVTATPSGQVLFTGRLGTYNHAANIIQNQSLIGVSDMEGNFVQYQTGTVAHFLFVQPDPLGGWYFGGNQHAQFEGGIVVRTDANFQVLNATSLTLPDGQTQLALLGMVALPDTPSVLVSLSGAYYGLGGYDAFNWAYLDHQGQVSGVHAISAAPNSTRIAMDNWKWAADGSILASGIQERSGLPSQSLLLHLPTAMDFPECCATEDSLLSTPVPFVLMPYTPSGHVTTPWAPLDLEVQTISNTVAQYPCQMHHFALQSKDTLGCPGECLELVVTDYTSPLTLFQWALDGIVDTTLKGPGPHLICWDTMTTHEVTVSAVGVCPAFQQAQTIGIRPVKTPNAFTPNGDGVNDTFAPLFYCDGSDYRFQIYSRWGQLLFESDQPLQGWDGQMQGQKAPMDTYIWMLHYAGTHLRGEVTLIR